MSNKLSRCFNLSVSLIIAVGLFVAPQIASAASIDFDEPVQGDVGPWSQDSWSFEALGGESVTVKMENVQRRWWLFSFPGTVDVSLVSEQGDVLESETCGGGACMEVEGLEAGLYTIVVKGRGYTTYELEISSSTPGYCLEFVVENMTWPFDGVRFNAYGAKNLATREAAEAEAAELMESIEGMDDTSMEIEISAGSCEALISDCGASGSDPKCVTDPTENDEEHRETYANMCEVRNAVKSRALPVDAPEGSDDAMLIYWDGKCGFCLEVTGEIIWPFDNESYSVYGAKNFDTREAAEAEAVQLEQDAEGNESQTVYTNVSLVSCGELVQDCGGFSEEWLCGVNMNGTEMTDYRNMCELENAVRTDAPDAQTQEASMVFYNAGSCSEFEQ